MCRNVDAVDAPGAGQQGGSQWGREQWPRHGRSHMEQLIKLTPPLGVTYLSRAALGWRLLL